MLGNGLAVLFALCAAVFAAVGIVVRQRATMDVPREKGVSTVMLRTLLRRFVSVQWIDQRLQSGAAAPAS